MKHSRRSVPLIRQAAAADCGAASLAMVLAYYGRIVPLDEIRKALRPGRQGSTATALAEVGAAYGLRSRIVSLDLDELHLLPTGAVLHWKFRHFVVLQRIRGDVVDIVDPAIGHRSVPSAVFGRAFTGVAITFETTDAFVKGGTKPKRLYALFGRVLEHRGTIASLVGISIAVQLLSAALPFIIGVFIDRVVPRRDYSLLWVLAAGYCGLQVFNSIFGYIREQLAIHLRTRLEAGFTLGFLDHLIRLPYEFFQQRTSGDLMMRLGANTAVRDILTSSLLSTFLDGFMATVYLMFLILFSLQLTSIVIALAAARLLVLAVMRWKQRKLLDESLENQAQSQTAQVEMLSAIETLKAMGLERQAAENWSNVFIDGLNISIRRGRLDAVFNVLLSILSTATTLVLTFYGGFLVLEGYWTLGSMMAFNTLAIGFLGPLNSLMGSALRLQLLEVYLDRLSDVWDTAPEQNESRAAPAEPLTGAMELERVSFTYAAQAPAVLDEVSVTIPSGARVAVVGRSGSGKSTFARLIAGLYEPNSGRILLDGRDFKTLDRRWVRRQFGIVTQDTQLLGGSIRRNIALADPDMSLDSVVAAAKLACVHDEIAAMPLKYETVLADRGLSLSGGQRQRLAIARALAARPRVLILDEATSHLDGLTEERLNANLASLRCTRIVIAHRLSTIQDADLILVLAAGRLVEAGRHDELLRIDGIYAELVGAQRESQRGIRRSKPVEAR